MSSLHLFSPPALVALALFFSGCGSEDAPTDVRVAQDLPSRATALAGHEVEEIPTSGFDARAGHELIRTPAEWEVYWNRIHDHISPGPPVPEVDLSGHVLLAVAMGERPSGGHAVRVEGVHEQDGSYWMTVQRLAPGPGCMSTSAITAPVTVVRMPAPSGTVHIVYRDVAVDCGA